jgi:hypothetical protein
MADMEQDETLELEEEQDVSQEVDSDDEPTTSYTEEDLKIFKRFDVDPENATLDDLVRLTKRLARAEEIKVEQKKNKTSEKPNT